MSQAQLEAFPTEYMALLTGKEIQKKSSLSKHVLGWTIKMCCDVMVNFNSLNVFRAMLRFPL